jgi:hypothetical protein
VARQTLLQQVMRYQAAMDRAMQAASSAEQLDGPADLNVFESGFYQRHGFASVICRK